MKYLLTLSLVFMALQPPALQACDMDDGQQAGHHATMQDDGAHGCCEAESDQPVEQCDESAQCAFFSLGFLVIPMASGVPATPAAHYFGLLDNNAYSGPPARRLLRPPIA